MSRLTKSQWADLISQCKSSGLSDFEWCRRNNIPQSSFYYQLKKQRDISCEHNEAVLIAPQTQNGCTMHEPEIQEVVPLIIRDDIHDAVPASQADVAARITINGISIEIYNSSQRDAIINVLSAVSSL